MPYLLIFLLCIASLLNLRGQELAAYSDYRGRFFVFDKGRSIIADDQKVESFKIGGNCVLFKNAQGHLKLYWQGEVKKLEVGGANNYFATDNIAAYSIVEKLKVIENGSPRVLSYRCPLYLVQDDIIVYFDKNESSLNIYSKGKIIAIESGLMGMPVRNLKSGDNIVAYISAQYGNFKVFYKGQRYTLLEHIDQVRFKAGKDIIAYVNPIDDSFNAFYKGEHYKLDDFPPESFKTGDGFVAYVDEMGAFKIFTAGTITEVGSFAPDEYLAEDNMLLFTEDGYFKIYCNSQVHEVEAYVPRSFVLDWNSVVYLDQTNRIWLFANGEKKYLVNEMIEDFNLYRDLVVMNVKMNRNLIYYKGKIYKGDSY